MMRGNSRITRSPRSMCLSVSSPANDPKDIAPSRVDYVRNRGPSSVTTSYLKSPEYGPRGGTLKDCAPGSGREHQQRDKSGAWDRPAYSGAVAHPVCEARIPRPRQRGTARREPRRQEDGRSGTAQAASSARQSIRRRIDSCNPVRAAGRIHRFGLTRWVTDRRKCCMELYPTPSHLFYGLVYNSS